MPSACADYFQDGWKRRNNGFQTIDHDCGSIRVARHRFSFDGTGRDTTRVLDGHGQTAVQNEREAGQRRHSGESSLIANHVTRGDGGAQNPTAYNATDATAATKTDTPIMQTPVSVTVVPQQVLTDQQTTTLDAALQNVSGVIPSNDSYGTGDSFSIRGFDQMELTYEDGLRTDEYSTSGFSLDLANIEQVQVVKGPNAVLYGQAEPGGLVDIVPKTPLSNPYYSLNQQVGSYAFYRTTGDATGPITGDKTLLYRFNVDYENAGSFRDFVYDKRLFLFPTLEWRPGQNDWVKMELTYGTGADIIDNGIPFLANGKPANVPLSRNYAEPNANYNPTNEYAVKLVGMHEFNEDWKLKLAYKSQYNNAPVSNAQYYLGDADSSGNLQRIGFTENYFNQWTSQVVLDLTGHFETFGIKHTLLTGFDYYGQNGHYDGNIYFPPSINIYNPVYGQPYAPPDPSTNTVVNDGQTAYGAYLQDQIEFPKHIFLLAGFRVDDVTTYDNGYTAAGAVHDPPQVTPRVGLLWQAIPQLSLYCSYTENYGATALGAITPSGQPLPPQSAQQYEVGAKFETLDKKFSATMSVYQLTKQNIPTTDPSNPIYQIAIGEARSQGVELEVSGEIQPGWKVIGGYSYINCVTLKNNETPSLDGLRLPDVPYNSGSLWTTYEFPDGSLKGLKLGAGVVGLGNQVAYESPTGTYYQADQIPGYMVVNAMASYEWKVGKAKMTAQVNINNVLDKSYFASVNPGQAQPGAPLSAMGSLRVEF
ncbi:MAG: TonB-dependent siderophore receptor [Methylacidiphilales bacterium]|nr:TonB-dependent siderophore receptor [Candidatus Methylacidiphilales bacterium]